MIAEQPGTNDRQINVDALMLDPENPRLPEDASSWSDARVIEFFRDEYAIDEVVTSMLDNGFFQQEPLIVLEEPDAETGRYIVVEGNRRLASLRYIHGDVEDDGLEPPPTNEQLERLRSIPCVVVASRDEVRTYPGFRHIGGIKDWSPEAKARFISVEVERVAGAGARSPFRDVGRMYGSNAAGVRNAYVALAILLHARDEFGIDVRHVQHHRFGVWQRLLNSGAEPASARDDDEMRTGNDAAVR